MTTAPRGTVPAREPELLGQTVVVIGGSAGIGLETARRARAEGADVILTGRDPDRLAGRARGRRAGTAAFDATDPAALERFFDELPAPVDHVMVTGRRPVLRAAGRPGPRRRRAAISTSICCCRSHVAQRAVGRVRPGGTLLFMGGTGGRRPGPGLGIVSALTAALPALIANLALELAPVRVNLIAAGLRRHAAVGVAARRRPGRAPRRAPRHAADRARRRPGRRRRARRAPHGQHGADRRDIRHRRRPAARPRVNRRRQ